LRSKVNVSRRSLRYATHRLMVMHPHTWIILFKKQLFDLEVKGQGYTKVITVCNIPPYGHVPTYQISLTYLERQKCYGRTRKYYLKNNYLTLRSKFKVSRRSLLYATHRPMVMHPYTWMILNYLILMSKVKVPRRSLRYADTALWSCTRILEWYYLKNNYLTLRSKVKVPRRSLRYATHHLMVMYPHTKYHWPISKDKNVMAGQENTI
jgi:hypothetical protein